jgi:hypothetical protein
MSEGNVSRRNVLKGAGIAGAAGLAAAIPMATLSPGVAAANAEESSADPLVGSWRGTASPSGGPSFGILTTYGVDGTLVNSASIDLQPNNLSTPGYGVWKRSDDGTYSVRFVFFTFDVSGNPSGSGEVKGQITVDDDEFHGPFSLTIFNSSGTVVFTGSGTVEATRIEAD